MTRSILMVMALLIVAGCGTKRPLMKPSEIPAYEERMRKKRERLELPPLPADDAKTTD